MKGIFGGLFDFNGDGKMSTFESAAELAFLESMSEKNRTEFERSGLDAGELEYMDEDERRRVLIKAGLDPDEYDF